jgi:hypothetical protein
MVRERTDGGALMSWSWRRGKSLIWDAIPARTRFARATFHVHLGLQERRQESRRLRNETCIPSFLPNICSVPSQSRHWARLAKKPLKVNLVSLDSDSETRLGTAGRLSYGSLNGLAWPFKEEILRACYQRLQHSLIPTKLTYVSNLKQVHSS